MQDRYQLLYKLGAGGMGSVWLAEDTRLKRTVALKELVQHVDGTNLDERRARALQEARAMARVRHPAIVSIYDVFFDRGDPWIVMEHINGRSLSAIIKEANAEASAGGAGDRHDRAARAARPVRRAPGQRGPP